MAYTPTTWATGDKISSVKMNKLEQGVADAQPALVSGTNIKTVNGASVLGAGNIEIGGAVDSVNGQTGTVVLDAADVGAASEAALARTNDMLDVLYKLTKGQAWDIVQDNTTAYQKTLPAGTHLSVLNGWGGNTVTVDGEAMHADVTKIVEHGKNLVSIQAQSFHDLGINLAEPLPAGTYTISFDNTNDSPAPGTFYANDDGVWHNIAQNQRAEITFSSEVPITLFHFYSNNVGWAPSQDYTLAISRVQVERGSTATEYKPYRAVDHTVPAAVRALTGYGQTGSAITYNSANKTWAYTYNGTTTDITDLMDGFDNYWSEVEPGGTLTFQNSHGADYEIPVPSQIDNYRNLSEVSLGTGPNVTLHNGETVTVTGTPTALNVSFEAPVSGTEYMTGLIFKAGNGFAFHDTAPSGYTIEWADEPTWTAGHIYEIIYRCLWVDNVIAAKWAEVTP